MVWGVDLGTLGAAGGGSGFINAVNADSPILAWATPDGTANAIDQSGNGRNGTVTGPVNVSATVLSGFDALQFDGTDDFVARTHEAALDVGDVFSLEVIFKRNRNSVAAGEVLLHKGNNAPTLWFPGTGANNNKLTLRKAAVNNVIEANADLTDTTSYHHAVATKNGATYALYIDGSSVGVDLGNQTMVNTTNDLRVGYSTGATQSLGANVAFAAYYGTALSSGRVSAHFSAIGT